MPYTAMQQLDLIKINKIKLINKINTLLGKDSGLAWDSSWTDIILAVHSIKTLLPEENQEIINEIEKFLANNSISEVIINSNEVIPYAFYQKNTVTSLVGPNIETIGTYSFYNDSQLTNINLPLVKTIKSNAFYNTRISELVLPEVTLIESQSFQNNTALVSAYLPKLERINSQVFSNCSALDTIVIPNLTYIEANGFYNTKVHLNDIPVNNLTYIGSYAFYNCTKLSEELSAIEILPQNNLTIGSYCFQNSNLSKDIFIGNKVTSIGDYAFNNCGSNTKFWCEAATKPSGWNSTWNSSNYPVNWGCVEKEYTFVKNNGEDDLVITKRYITNEDFPVVEKEGYQLDSWYLDENFTREVSTPYYSKVNSTESAILYARWTRGFNLKAINIEDNFSETDLGIYYFNNISEFKNYIGTFNCVGYYENYNNQIFSNVVSDLDSISGLLPTLYVKATNLVTRVEVHDFDYTGSAVEVTLEPGEHKLECWGAQGGSVPSAVTAFGGKGGYSVGNLIIKDNTPIFVYVGEEGKAPSLQSSMSASFNGGGAGRSNSYYGCSGGGASDIRISNDSLYARIIVAGGGGGAHTNPTEYAGGVGGGEISGGSVQTRATQTTPGSYYNNSYNTAPTFGVGGSALPNGTSAGGGGGWYGGSAQSINDHNYQSGGGSGYVYNSNSAANYPSECLLDSSKYLVNSYTFAGDQEFLSPSGISEIGHSGNGYVRITSTTQGTQESNFKGCIVNLKGILNNEIVYLDVITLMHNIQKNTLKDNFGNYVNPTSEWYFDEECTVPVEDIIEIKTDNTEITLYSQVVEIIELNFEYTGECVPVTLSPATYKLECWGAEGGHTNVSYSTSYIEGHGGYASGILVLNESTNLFINVGGAGAVSGSGTVALGGFNGGGNGHASGRATTSGGGGSDIRIGTDSLYARVLVAGGGGGGRDAGNQGYTQVIGRSCGGGTIGLQGGYYSGSSVTTSTNRNGRGGGGGGYNQAGATGNIENSETLYPAQFGLGGYCANGSTYGEGGGGGWYGGGAGSADADGGGGSSYAYTAETAQYYPTGCLLTQKYYLTNITISAGNQEFLAPNNSLEVGHQGNGYIRITKVS